MCVSIFYSPGSISDGNPIVYWFDMISDLLIYDVSEAVLNPLVHGKDFFKKVESKSFFKEINRVVIQKTY